MDILVSGKGKIERAFLEHLIQDHFPPSNPNHTRWLLVRNCLVSEDLPSWLCGVPGCWYIRHGWCSGAWAGRETSRLHQNTGCFSDSATSSHSSLATVNSLCRYCPLTPMSSNRRERLLAFTSFATQFKCKYVKQPRWHHTVISQSYIPRCERSWEKIIESIWVVVFDGSGRSEADYCNTLNVWCVTASCWLLSLFKMSGVWLSAADYCNSYKCQGIRILIIKHGRKTRQFILKL